MNRLIRSAVLFSFLFLFIVVYACPHIKSITVPSFVCVNEEFEIMIDAAPNKSHKDWEWDNNKTFNYKLSRTDLPDIILFGRNGKDKHVLSDPGVYTVTARALGAKDGNTAWGEWGGSETITVVDVEFDKSSLLLCVEEKDMATATVNPSSASSEITYAIKDTSIAKIESQNSGVIKINGIKKGITTLQAKLNSKVCDEVEITVGEGVLISTPERGGNLPASVPLQGTREVTVKYCEESNGSEVTFTIEGNAGKANFNGENSITKTSSAGGTDTLTIKGIKQTPPNKALGLKIVAKINGKKVGKSGGFSVCAHATDMVLDRVESRYLTYGFIVRERPVSDAPGGDNGLLDRCFGREHLEYSEWNRPWQMSFVNINDNFISLNVPWTDEHKKSCNILEKPVVNAGNIVANQTHYYYCKRCGMNKSDEVPMPAEYTITYECSKNANGEYQVVTTKKGTGGNLSSDVEAASPPKKPSNLAVAFVTDRDDDKWFKVKLAWQDNSEIELKYEYSFRFNGFRLNVGSTNSDVEEKLHNRSFNKKQMSGKELAVKLRAYGRECTGHSEYITKKVTYAE